MDNSNNTESVQKEQKISTKHYNTTDLDPFTAIDRNIVHRDQNAHIFRFSYIVKEAKVGDNICDFGCGKANMLELMYRNKYKPSKYVGIDIRKQTIEQNKIKFNNLNFPVEFYTQDLIYPSIDLNQIQADKVVSFEVAEHVGKHNISTFLENFKKCGSENAIYYLSTPNYDPQVGAAGNHTYDAGDGHGVQPQEFDHFELAVHIKNAGFEVVKKFGTFASQKDYKKHLNDWQQKMFTALSEYYDSNAMSNIMAPFFPEKARNCLWVLKVKK